MQGSTQQNGVRGRASLNGWRITLSEAYKLTSLGKSFLMIHLKFVPKIL